jgi:lipoprotein-anchoring transpeptidase ErfK/SrfK
MWSRSWPAAHAPLRRRRAQLVVALAAVGFLGTAAGNTCILPASPAFAGNLAKIPRTHGVATREEISLQTGEARGSIIISARQKTLDYVLGNGRAYRYRIGVGRDGFGWSGIVKVGRKAEWPEWRPPKEMLQRDPTLPTMMPGGPLNPLGARAIYLFQDGRDSLYRIHGTSEAESIGAEISSGCFRMTNRDVMDLYRLVAVGAKVIVE